MRTNPINLHSLSERLSLVARSGILHLPAVKVLFFSANPLLMLYWSKFPLMAQKNGAGLLVSKKLAHN